MKIFHMECQYCGYKWVSHLYWVPDEAYCAKIGCRGKQVTTREEKSGDVFGYETDRRSKKDQRGEETEKDSLSTGMAEEKGSQWPF